MIPLSLYIHFPWCVKKCPYCDFNSHTLKQDLPEEEYISQLLKDFKAELPRIKHRKIHSIFMGGGTPSLFSPKSIKYLLKTIKDHMEFENPGCEITLEANPGTVEQERFSGFLDAGINRLSLGIQSFSPDKLKKLGRIHDDIAAFRAIESAKSAGFTNFNLDLMHGLPSQTLEEALKDIDFAIQSKAPHISWYQLTLEPNTLFYQKKPVLPSENILNHIYTSGHHIFKHHKYNHYEISAYSHKGVECRHNVNYWEFGDYIGIGAGAHGKITDLSSQKIIRTLKPKHPKEYMNTKDFSAIPSEHIQDNHLAFEFMLNSLRLEKPISWNFFSERCFLDKKSILAIMERLHQKNLMIYDDNIFELTDLGRRFLNDVLTEFLPSI